jgi:hypothetical protein
MGMRLGHDNAAVTQSKALLAAEIIKILERERVSVRRACARLHNVDLGHFTLDRVSGILNRLGSRVEVR